MRKIILYIASSLDGKIADDQGSVSWLDTIPNPEKADYGYHDFFASIDTTLMGNTTYKQVLGFGIGNPYKGKTNFVITKNPALKKDEHVQYISENVVQFILNLKEQSGKAIWCVGGAQLNALLMDHGLLDELRIFIMPIILGEGIPLTSKLKKFTTLELVDINKYLSGVLELRYAFNGSSI